MNFKVTAAARYVLGVIFLVFGSNGLMMMVTGSGFIPMPPPTPEMGAAMGGLFAAKYLMPLVKVIQVMSALMLLSNKFTNLAVTLLGPVVINIFLMHLFLDPAGLPVAIIVFILWGVLLKSKWSVFKPLVSC
ncbi:MAG: hypothetical protein ACRBBP_00875 [Bdellovibrionales bacterium]